MFDQDMGRLGPVNASMTPRLIVCYPDASPVLVSPHMCLCAHNTACSPLLLSPQALFCVTRQQPPEMKFVVYAPA